LKNPKKIKKDRISITIDHFVLKKIDKRRGITDRSSYIEDKFKRMKK